MIKRSVGKEISKISRNLSRYVDAETKHLGLTIAAIPFLTYLLEKDGVHQEEMAENLHFDKSSAARAVTALENMGYARRVTDETNKRRNIIYVTEKAKSIEAELLAILQSLTDKLYEGFSEEEKDAYFEATAKINDNLMKLLGKNK